MVYFAPLIFIISTWIAIIDRSWRPFCASVALFSAANILYAILNSVFDFHWETNIIYYVTQDFLLLVAIWIINKYLNPAIYNETRNLAEPLIILMYVFMIFYNIARWWSSSFPFAKDSIYLEVANIIYYNYSVAFATINGIIISLLLLGGGLHVWIWRNYNMVNTKLSDDIRISLFSWWRIRSISKRKGM